MGSLVNDARFWKDRRVLLTGHTGFKGSWLSLWLQSMGAELIGYALEPPTTPSLFELAGVGEGMVHIIGDVRDLDNLCTVIAHHRPEIIIHMAAQALVQPSYRDPVGTYTTNVMGTVNLLEAARRGTAVRVVVSVTSDKCYENRERLRGYRENERMGGYDPYSSSKGCAELVIAAYRNSFFSSARASQGGGLALGSARAGNVIGGGDWAEDRLIPDILRALLDGRPAVIRNPRATRPWQHVLEPLSAYLVLAEKLWHEGHTYAEGWNFGPADDDTRTVSYIVDRVTTLWGEGASWILDHKEHAHEVQHLKLDCSKAKTKLGWQSQLGVDTALEWLVEWYKAYRDAPQSIQDITVQQIRRYQGIE